MHKGVWYASLALALGLAAVGCQSSDSTGPRGGTGTVSVALTDAPLDSVTAAVVTISDIYLQRTDNDSVSTSNRVYLRQNVNTTVNLLQLRDSLRTLVASAEVPAGTYSQLRIVITGAYIQVRNANGSISTFATPNYAFVPAGTQVTGTLVMPSFATSGLKVIFPGGFTITGDSNTQLVADFDLAQSLIHQAGNSGQWVLRPVVKIVNLSTISSLTVNVALGTGVTLPTGVALTGFTVQVTDASGNVRTAPLVVGTGGTASATFTNLLPTNGPYQVTLVAPTGVTFTTTSPLPLTGVNLTAGAGVTQTITLSAVTKA